MQMNLPNAITLSRLLMLGGVVAMIFTHQPWAAQWAFILFLVAAGTDWLDGYLARKLNQITAFGKIMDALVDKLLVIGVLLALWWVDWLALGRDIALLNYFGLLLIILVALRDISVTTLRALAARKGHVLAAGKGGKLKMIWQVGSVSLLLLARWWQWRYASDWVWQSVWFLGMALLTYSTYLSVRSGWHYVRSYLPILKGKPKAGS